jgi:hypothetical protein
MTGKEARRFSDEASQIGRHHVIPEEPVTTTIVDFDSALSAWKDAWANILAQKFDELTIFEDFTANEYYANASQETP